MSTLSAMPTDVSEQNLFDGPDPEMNVQEQWFRQLFTYASVLAVSAARRQGLRDYPRTTAPMQPHVVPELANNASAGRSRRKPQDSLGRRRRPSSRDPSFNRVCLTLRRYRLQSQAHELGHWRPGCQHATAVRRRQCFVRHHAS